MECIDILPKIEDGEITMALKDLGVEFNPSTYTCKEKDSFENIEMLQKIADDINYARLICVFKQYSYYNKEVGLIN